MAKERKLTMSRAFVTLAEHGVEVEAAERALLASACFRGAAPRQLSSCLLVLTCPAGSAARKPIRMFGDTSRATMRRSVVRVALS